MTTDPQPKQAIKTKATATEDKKVNQGENKMATNTQPNGNKIEERKSAQETVLPVHQSKIALAPLPNNRPIEPSHLRLSSTYTAVGSQRPVSISDLDIVSTISSSGIRPVSATTLQITEIIGNRPIAPNYSGTESEEDFVGYMD